MTQGAGDCFGRVRGSGGVTHAVSRRWRLSFISTLGDVPLGHWHSRVKKGYKGCFRPEAATGSTTN